MTTINPTPEHRQELRALLAKATEECGGEIESDSVAELLNAFPALLNYIDKKEAEADDHAERASYWRNEAGKAAHHIERLEVVGRAFLREADGGFVSVETDRAFRLALSQEQ